jgi:adenylate cyclase
MTDIKLIFDFCAEAHCFDNVYAKVLPAEEYEQKSSLQHLGITSMNHKDREVLKKWISEAS